jgi:restriction system protein
MVLRTIHELFEADTVNALASIILNGWVSSLDKQNPQSARRNNFPDGHISWWFLLLSENLSASNYPGAADKGIGHEVSRCILTINVTRQAFLAINLANVDPRQCFKKLKGMSSAKLSDLVPVAPILDLNREDRRFVQSYDVTGTIQEGDNLAVMHWEDFEHLIRELFEKEFGTQGGEVKVTQASRDGNVDAVIFDPDPIRGGKIVVQAKRYTNTVDVAAVRDLYGTVINEGAMKGILITTSDYGQDAFHFAKDKPLTLMNGANLLYLVEKHGKKARIDLKEAKRA